MQTKNQEKWQLKIYWQDSCRRLLPPVKQTIRQNLPRLEPVEAAELTPDQACYDSSRVQYDAVELLQTLPPAALTLYIVDEDLYYPGYEYLYGASLSGRAVVSSFRTCSVDGFCKEVCHELGHALGLEHCRQTCLMQTAQSERQLTTKAKCFCPACQKKLGHYFMTLEQKRDILNEGSFTANEKR